MPKETARMTEPRSTADPAAVKDKEMKQLQARIARHEAERAKERAELRRWSDSVASEYREGFIDGYLRAHEDGQEYQCSIESAELAFGKYLSEGGRSLPRQNIEGW